MQILAKCMKASLVLSKTPAAEHLDLLCGRFKTLKDTVSDLTCLDSLFRQMEGVCSLHGLTVSIVQQAEGGIYTIEVSEKVFWKIHR